MAEPTQQTSTQLPPQPTLDIDFPFGAQPDISKLVALASSSRNAC